MHNNLSNTQYKLFCICFKCVIRFHTKWDAPTQKKRKFLRNDFSQRNEPNSLLHIWSEFLSGETFSTITFEVFSGQNFMSQVEVYPNNKRICPTKLNKFSMFYLFVQQMHSKDVKTRGECMFPWEATNQKNWRNLGNYTKVRWRELKY